MLDDVRARLIDAARSYTRHDGRMLAAAVAFSSLLSIAPLLFIALSLASLVTGDAAARATLQADLASWIGSDGAATVSALLAHTGHGGARGLGFFSGAVLVYASTRLFSQMKRALNHMWDIRARPAGGVHGKVGKQLRKRAVSFLMVLFVGVLLVAAVVAKALLSATTDRLGGGAHAAFEAGEALVSLGTTTLLFAMIFQVLPDARMAPRDAWRGALVTALLFEIGATLIGAYLGHKALADTYGAAASVVMLLLWVHYSAQIFFFGAAMTGELARHGGRAIVPDDHGVRVRVEDDEVSATPDV